MRSRRCWRRRVRRSCAHSRPTRRCWPAGHEFAVIVLDIRMPGMTGFELAQLIKQRKRSRTSRSCSSPRTLDESDVLRGYGVGRRRLPEQAGQSRILRSKVAVFVDLFRADAGAGGLNEALKREVAERGTRPGGTERGKHELGAPGGGTDARALAGPRGRARERGPPAHGPGRGADDCVGVAAPWRRDDVVHVPEELFGFPAGALGHSGSFCVVSIPTIGKAAAPAWRRASGRRLRLRLSRRQTHGWRPGSLTGRVCGGSGEGDRMVGMTRNVTREREAAHEREDLLRREAMPGPRPSIRSGEGRVPGDAEPRAAHADERHSRVALDHLGGRHRPRVKSGPRSKSSKGTHAHRRS